MNRFQLQEWWRYRLRAQGRHGVHSPFVYRLADECLLRPNGQHLEQRLKQYFSTWDLHQLPDTPPIPAILPQALHERSILMLPGIHQSVEALRKWEALRSRADVTLSVDLFKYGLLFFHPDFKVKQHFVLKHLR